MPCPSLTEEKARTGLRKLREKGMHKINFAGGEPFLKPKFLGNLVKFCKAELGINTSIISNGSLVTEKWLNEYGEYLDILGVSCDSFVESTNEKIGRSDKKGPQGRYFNDVHNIFGFLDPLVRLWH